MTSKTQSGKLYICPTPIGNLEDITLRALRILKEADFILAEDTRNTQKLLNHYEIKTKLISYHKYCEKEKAEEIIKHISEGKTAALVSDSGTPLVSDPGHELIITAIKHNIPIIPLPGACAAISAISASPLTPDGFIFIGFPSKTIAKKKAVLNQMSQIELPIVLYESPQRVYSTLECIYEILGDVKVTIARELTKIHEEIITAKTSELIKHYETTHPRGEFTIIIDKIPSNKHILSHKDLETLIKNKLEHNHSVSEIAKELSKELGVNKNVIYKTALSLTDTSNP